MIWDSWPWKRKLARQAILLHKRKNQKRWTEVSSASVEQEIFLAAYSIRKLLDANKLSDEIESSKLQALAYEPNGHMVDIMNWHKIDQLYNLSRSSHTTISLREFCNQIIHSFVFMFSVSSDNGLEGLFFTSDRDRSSRLLYLSIDEVIAIMKHVSKDDIVQSHSKRDSATGEMKVISKSCKH